MPKIMELHKENEVQLKISKLLMVIHYHVTHISS
uniref:Uncharacterized protein n=1 Tax=Arundo donax TaxID=35708 RepID=A0A0A8YAP5_ARUDO